MDGLPLILKAGLAGFLSGFLLSIPVGPVNLTIMNEAARRGFFWALFIGIGASAMELFYCAVAFTGFASVFENRFVKTGMELLSFIFLFFLGMKFLLAKSVVAPTHLGGATDKFQQRVEARFQPHSAFMTGFVRTLANPGVLLFWIILAANLMSRGWVPADGPGKSACVAGVGVGTGLWFLLLSFGCSRRRGRVREKTLLRMEQFSGVCLLVLAVLHGGQIVWQLAHSKNV